MDVIVFGLGFERVHFIILEDCLPQIVIFNDSHLAIREVLPLGLVGGLQNIPPRNNEFLIEKLSLRPEGEISFLLEGPTEQHDFCFEVNNSNQNGCQEIETKSSCRLRSPPRA